LYSTNKQIEIMENTKSNNPYVHPIQENTLTNYGGITLRDYFAAKAMQSIIISNHYDFCRANNGLPSPEFITNEAYNFADEMLKQREL
jgi:hypothetical protein